MRDPLDDVDLFGVPDDRVAIEQYGHTHPAAQYTAALTELTKQCKQTDPVQLAAMTDSVWTGLEKAGVTDEDRLSLLQHFSESIPAGAPRMDCVQIFAAYETLREG